MVNYFVMVRARVRTNDLGWFDKLEPGGTVMEEEKKNL